MRHYYAMPSDKLLYPVVSTKTGQIAMFGLVEGGTDVGNFVSGSASKLKTGANIVEKILKPSTPVLRNLVADGTTFGRIAKASPFTGAAVVLLEGVSVLSNRHTADIETRQELESKSFVSRGLYGLSNPLKTINSATAEIGRAIKATSELKEAYALSDKLESQGIPLIPESPDID